MFYDSFKIICHATCVYNIDSQALIENLFRGTKVLSVYCLTAPVTRVFTLDSPCVVILSVYCEAIMCLRLTRNAKCIHDVLRTAELGPLRRSYRQHAGALVMFMMCGPCPVKVMTHLGKPFPERRNGTYPRKIPMLFMFFKGCSSLFTLCQRVCQWSCVHFNFIFIFDFNYYVN